MKIEDLHNLILLEKDHRKNLKKMGLSDRIADRLHNFNNKYSIWFAKQFLKTDYFSNLDELQQEQYLDIISPEMQNIVDWVRNGPNVILKDHDWQSAMQAADQWHRELKVKGNLFDERNKVIKEYDDGFYWVDFEAKSCREEADNAGHCGTTNAGETLWGLRKYNKVTKKVESFITIAISPSKKTWHQCKGKRNSKPKESYFYYITDIFLENSISDYYPEHNAGADFDIGDYKTSIETIIDKSNYSNVDQILKAIKENEITYEKFDKFIEEKNESEGDIRYWMMSETKEYHGSYGPYERLSVRFGFLVDLESIFKDRPEIIEIAKKCHRSGKKIDQLFSFIRIFYSLVQNSSTGGKLKIIERGNKIYMFIPLRPETGFNENKIGYNSLIRYYEYTFQNFDMSRGNSLTTEVLKKIIPNIFIEMGLLYNDVKDVHDRIATFISDVDNDYPNKIILSEYKILSDDYGKPLRFSLKLKYYHDLKGLSSIRQKVKHPDDIFKTKDVYNTEDHISSSLMSPKYHFEAANWLMNAFTYVNGDQKLSILKGFPIMLKEVIYKSGDSDIDKAVKDTKDTIEKFVEYCSLFEKYKKEITIPILEEGALRIEDINPEDITFKYEDDDTKGRKNRILYYKGKRMFNIGPLYGTETDGNIKYFKNLAKEFLTKVLGGLIEPFDREKVMQWLEKNKLTIKESYKNFKTFFLENLNKYNYDKHI